MQYLIRRRSALPRGCDWDGPAWGGVEALAIDQFHPQSGPHRPRVQAKLLHTGDTLAVIYRVLDRHVRGRFTNYLDPVWTDSCVELFVEPKRGGGYFNFETNCIGTLLLYYVEDPTRVGTELKKYRPVAAEHAAHIRIETSLPKATPVEIAESVEWRLALSIPVAVMEMYAGPIGELGGQAWRGNLYKCGDETSQPHWASWSPIGDALNFHQPSRFGELQFE